MNISKRIVTFLLTVAMLLSMLSTFGIVAQAETISEGVEYVFDEETGVITFSGTGVIPGYEKDEQPWISFRDKITKIVIGNGITSIGENVFTTGNKTSSPKYFYNVTELILPNTVTKIGNSAFQGTGITSISFPDSVTELVSWSFAYCGNLANVSLPEQFTTINRAVFWGDNNIQKLYVPVTVETVKGEAFTNANIDTIYYQGTEEQFKAITIEKTTKKTGEIVDYNVAFRNANVVYNHTHSYTDKYDAAYHWKECVCSDIINYGAHTFENSDLKCDSCEFKRVAKIGDVNYTSFNDAYAAAENGDTIKLCDDVKLTGKLTITKAITIDGNGHSIKADETATWYTVSGKLNIKSYSTHLLGLNSDNIILKDVVLDCNNNAAGINIYCAQNVTFDNVSIINATKGMAALTVNGSTLTVKTAFTALGNSIALDISNGSGVTSDLGVTVEEGTVFNLGDKTVKFASVAKNNVTNAVDAEGKPYFAAMDSGYYYTQNQINTPRATAYSNGLTLLADVELSNDIKVKGTLNLNGNNLVINDGYTVNVENKLTVTGDGEATGTFTLTKETATLTGPAGLKVTTNVNSYYVVYDEETGVYTAKIAELPNVVITDVEDNPGLMFALNFGIENLDKLIEDEGYVKAIGERYGNPYVDYVLTIEGLTEENVTFNANGGADGYLAGQYNSDTEDYNGTWINVPFDDVTMQNGESLYIMQYASETFNEPGLRYTLAEVAMVVRNFNCGVFFEPDFIAKNPNAKITLELKVFNEDENGTKEHYALNNSTRVFTFDKYVAAIVAEGKDTQVFTTVSGALEAAKAGEKVILLRDATDKYVIVTPGVTLDLVGNDLTADYVVTFKNSAVIDSTVPADLKRGVALGKLIVAEDNVTLRDNNHENQLPLYDTDGYVFFKIANRIDLEKCVFIEDGYQYYFSPNFNGNDWNKANIGDGVIAENIQFKVRLDWIGSDGNNCNMYVSYTDDLVKGAYSVANHYLIFETTGITGFKSLTLTPMVVSETGAEIELAKVSLTDADGNLLNN